VTFFVIKGFCRNGTSGNQESRLKIHLVSSGVALDGLESRLGSKASYIVAKHGAMRTHHPSGYRISLPKVTKMRDP